MDYSFNNSIQIRPIYRCFVQRSNSIVAIKSRHSRHFLLSALNNGVTDKWFFFIRLCSYRYFSQMPLHPAHLSCKHINISSNTLTSQLKSSVVQIKWFVGRVCYSTEFSYRRKCIGYKSVQHYNKRRAIQKKTDHSNCDHQNKSLGRWHWGRSLVVRGKEGGRQQGWNKWLVIHWFLGWFMFWYYSLEYNNNRHSVHT